MTHGPFMILFQINHRPGNLTWLKVPAANSVVSVFRPFDLTVECSRSGPKWLTVVTWWPYKDNMLKKITNRKGCSASGSGPPSCSVRLLYASLPLELPYSSENSGARLALTPFMMIHGPAAVITACRAAYQFPFSSLLPSALVLQTSRGALPHLWC